MAEATNRTTGIRNPPSVQGGSAALLEDALAGRGVRTENGRVVITDCESVVVVTLQNPARLNALDLDGWQQLAASFERLGRREALRLVVMRGAGGCAFSAGADIGEFPEKRQSAQAAARYNDAIAAAIRAVMAIPVPVIAMIEGLAVGGGCELAAACDIRIAARESRLGLPLGRLGVMQGLVEAYAVVRVIGAAQLKWLLFSGELISADEALTMGLVHRVVDALHLGSEVVSLGARILAASPLSMRGAKQVTDMVTRGLTLQDADTVARLAAETYGGDDFRRRVNIFLDHSAKSNKGV